MKKTQVLLIIFLYIITACNNDNDFEETIQSNNKTIIIYFAADNDLSEDALRNIEEIQNSYVEVRTNLIVFLDSAEEEPVLFKVEVGKNHIIKKYPELNSADSTTMKYILEEVIHLYPSDNYGLILWSHGTSWLPANKYTRAFGEDSGSQINITELADILPVYFDFILFDACLMGAVEVAYELRNNTDYIIASSTEILAEGFPYEKIIPELLKKNVNLKKVGEDYFNFYNSQTGMYRSATVSLVNTFEIESLAKEVYKLIDEEYLDFSLNRSSVQRLDVYQEQYHFDLGDFIKKTFPEQKTKSFFSQLNKTIEYKRHTPEFLKSYDIQTYCGLSCYIPHPMRKDLNEYYRSLQWYNACRLDKIFN